MRNNHLTSCDCRGVAVSNDGGTSFGPVTYDDALVSPVCMASVISARNGDLVFANPASKTGRINGTVRRSTDGGATWSSSLPVSGPSAGYAYSCLSWVPDHGQLGLLWETTSSGCDGPSCQSVFSAFPAAF